MTKTTPDYLIVETRFLDLDEEDQEITFRTFRNFTRAWVMLIEDEFGSIQSSQFAPNLSSSIAANKNRKSSYSTLVRQNFIRGELTLRAMEYLPVLKQPELATSAVLWVPVQAYYAIHGFGQALISLQNGIPPLDHTTFRKTMIQFMRKLPGPLAERASPKLHNKTMECGFHVFDVDDEDVTAQHHLETPSDDNASLLAAKSLRATRLALWREGKPKLVPKGKKRLARGEPMKLWQRLHDTTLVDFLWRMRTRSNYDDVGMFLYATQSASEASHFYSDTTKLAIALATALKSMISARLTPKSYERLEAEVAKV